MCVSIVRRYCVLFWYKIDTHTHTPITRNSSLTVCAAWLNWVWRNDDDNNSCASAKWQRKSKQQQQQQRHNGWWTEEHSCPLLLLSLVLDHWLARWRQHLINGLTRAEIRLATGLYLIKPSNSPAGHWPLTTYIQLCAHFRFNFVHSTLQCRSLTRPLITLAKPICGLDKVIGPSAHSIRHIQFCTFNSAHTYYLLLHCAR